MQESAKVHMLKSGMIADKVIIALLATILAILIIFWITQVYKNQQILDNKDTTTTTLLTTQTYPTKKTRAQPLF